ncbi:sensor histidine kinase [Paracoccus sp. SM22M-07]|uniref:sensor histidine kinase n=1 Tax=Paracoccus sp. SM22M-07 TaxID=1520813 RepID=UPI000930614B|nr:ATP-binding protein [Paracoccus sp. SM22M-07]
MSQRVGMKQSFSATRFWRDASLSTRFAVVGGVVLAIFMGLAGWLLADRIRQVVIRNTATAAAFYMDSFLHPLVEDYIPGTQPSPAMRRALSEVLPATGMAERIVSYKVWGKGGLVIAASNADLMGRNFPPSHELSRAWSGQIAAIFEDDAEEEDRSEHALGLPLLEIYSPIRADWTGEIIAVAELYIADPALKADLAAARAAAWAGVGGGGLALGLILYVIVRQGSRTIDRQRRDLDRQLKDLRRLSHRNGQLRARIQEAAGRAAATTEGGLRRIGADLHDGPAQDLAYARLRLDALDGGSTPQPGELAAIQQALDRAMSEIRQISHGLALPELAHLSAAAIPRLAVEAHQARCPTPVALHMEAEGDPPLSPGLRICLFRFVQEGLNNAARHAGGADLTVRLQGDADRLRVTVSDAGPGPAPDHAPGLGLRGLRDRVESLGGRFGMERRDGRTELWMEVET